MKGASRARAPGMLALGLCLLAGVAVAQDAARSDPALARRLYDLAGDLAAEGKGDQALERYREAWAADRGGELADDALLAMARLRWPAFDFADLGRFDGERLAAARPLLEQVRRDYPRGNAAAEALFRLALMALDPANPERDPDEAWSDFAAIVSVYPDSTLADRALSASAVLDERLGRRDSALLSWFRVVDEYPSGGFAARARLGLGRNLLALGRPAAALGELQAAREASGDDAATAAEALDLLELAARLAAPGTTAPGVVYRYDGSLGGSVEIRSGDDLLVLPSGELLLADRASSAVLAIRRDGGAGSKITFPRPSALALGPQGDLWIAGPADIQSPTSRRVLTGGDERKVERPGALAAGPWGAWLIDADRRQLLRLGRDGGFREVVELPEGTVPADLAAAPGGGVLVLDSRGVRVLVLDDSGHRIATLAPPASLGLRRPVALDRDLAGNIYFLDGRERRVIVLRPDGSLLAQIVSPKEGEGAFVRPTALAVDRAGRVLLFDAREKRVVRFR